MDHVTRPLIEGVLTDLLPLIQDRQDGPIRTVLVNLHPADIAAFITFLGDEDEQLYIFSLLHDPEIASSVLTELPGPVREDLMEEIPHEDLADLVEEMDSDDAVDIVQELPDDVASRVLEDIEPEELAAMRPLLAYDEDTAGGIMATEFLRVDVSGTVGDARDVIRAEHDEVEGFFYVYVVQNGGRLAGMVSLKDLVLQRSAMPIVEAMTVDPISVPPEMDQEEVAEIFRRYDLVAVPVVNAEGKILGRITVDDVVDVMREEAEEDIARMAGTVDEEFDETSVRRITFLRLPWLLTGMFGGLFAGAVMRHFTGPLESVIVILVVFVPVITAMGGNAGSQSAVIMVRRLALRRLRLRDVAGVIYRESRVGLVMGLICGVVVGGAALLWRGDAYYGLVVGMSMVAVVLVAATLGALVPIIFQRFRVDPAIATGPFITVSNDVIGLFIYFGLAYVLLQVVGPVAR